MDGGASPVADGAHPVLDFPREQVTVVHKPLATLKGAIHLVLVGLHGAQEVLVLLQRLLGSCQSVGLVDVSQGVFLRSRQRARKM